MGECGCCCISWQFKIKNNEDWILFRVYPSCDYCCSPVGVDFFKVDKNDYDLYDVEHVPEIDFGDENLKYVNIIDPEVVRKKMQKAILGYEPHEGKIGEVDADVLADEAFPDLRNCVFETQKNDPINN